MGVGRLLVMVEATQTVSGVFDSQISSDTVQYCFTLVTRVLNSPLHTDHNILMYISPVNS